MPEVSRYAVTVGESGVQNMRLNQGSALGSEIAQINVDLIDKNERELSVDDLIIDLKSKVESIPGVEFKFSVIDKRIGLIPNGLIRANSEENDIIKNDILIFSISFTYY